MPEQQPNTPLIWDPSGENNIVAVASLLEKQYDRGACSYEHYMRYASDDARFWLCYFQFIVTGDNWQKVPYIDSADWLELESRLLPGGEWWYVADTTPTMCFGSLIQV